MNNLHFNQLVIKQGIDGNDDVRITSWYGIVLIIHILWQMVKVRAFNGFTFKPELYGQILHKNMEYLEGCQILKSFNTQEFLAKGLLKSDDQQFIYLYEQQFLGFCTLGLLAQLSLIEYAQKKIKKHEKTLFRPHLNESTYAKEHVGPVIVGHEFVKELDEVMISLKTLNSPFACWDTVDGRRHRLWRIASFSQIVKSIEGIKNFYILDGHHRFEAASAHLEKQGADAKEKDKWIQGLVYSTKYIRTYPQFRKLVHEDCRTIIRGLMSNQKLVIEEVLDYDPLSSNMEIVLLLDQKFYNVIQLQDQGPAHAKTGVEKLDCILKQAFLCAENKAHNPIKFVPSILFDLEDLSAHTHPVFLVKSPQISTIFEIANQDQFLPPKSTWLEPKPCLHMVVRVPY